MPITLSVIRRLSHLSDIANGKVEKPLIADANTRADDLQD
jgi:hypothetical protein